MKTKKADVATSGFLTCEIKRGLIHSDKFSQNYARGLRIYRRNNGH